MIEENEDEGAGDSANPPAAGPGPAKGDAGGDMKRSDIIKTARKIAEEYHAQGLVLTVRQLYYQFVARGLLGSGQKIYKRIVASLADARMENAFPMHLIEDRGRDVGDGAATLCEDSVDRGLVNGRNIIGNLPETLIRKARWHGQPYYVSVFVEKEALAGVFDDPCKELGVGLFPCKGYPSVSSLYLWATHYMRACATRNRTGKDGWNHNGQCQRAMILYFGDHDPDGCEIPKSIERSLETMQRNGVLPRLPEIEFRRVALNMEQIEEYNPPPFEAKVTSSRYQNYIETYDTDEAWELDALDPAVLRTLIRENVEEFFDDDIHEANNREVSRKRKELRSAMKGDGWFAETIDIKGDGEDEADEEEEEEERDNTVDLGPKPGDALKDPDDESEKGDDEDGD